MAVNTILTDGKGAGGSARINGEGELSVVVHPHPPKDEESVALPFRQYFTSTGLSGGTTDMRVAGTLANPSEFYISAIGDRDIYIKTVSVIIADAGAALNEFGNLTALTNGVEFGWESQDEGTIIIHEGLKTNFQFMRLANGSPAIGGGTDAFQAANVVGASEAYIPSIDISATFGLQYGIRLRKGTQDKLYFKVRDNVTTIDQFDAIAYGIKF